MLKIEFESFYIQFIDYPRSIGSERLANFEISLISIFNKYKFILCPLGNGVDSHRIWETLYSGSIPIVLDKVTFKCLDGLPVIKLKSFRGLKIEKII